MLLLLSPRCAFPLVALGLLTAPAWATDARPRPLPAAFGDPLVEVKQACPGVVVELRYATARNITGQPIYPAGARALLRRNVAERLNQAQRFVQEQGFGIKVWDAYRPASVQRLLWQAVRNPAYVVEPSDTGSLHGWGAAVDVTLVDARKREVRMPTDFDSFSAAARYDYCGGDPEIAANLSVLKRAMTAAGFRHIRDEWWHYSEGNAAGSGPIEASLAPAPVKVAKTAPAKAPKPKAAKVAAVVKKKPRVGRVLFAPRPGETL
jgi:D-alanyl-D-alanine dipeptidase